MNGIHVLLVEDNEGDIMLTTEAFEERTNIGKISVVKDGKAALEFLFKMGEYHDVERPDLVILDVNLPKKNGLEVLIAIRNSNGLKSLPVIMLTTSSSPKDINVFYENHANGFITKPVEIDNFEDIIKKIEIFWQESIR